LEKKKANVFFHEWKFLGPKLRDTIKVRLDAYAAYFRSVIEEGIKQSVFHVQDVGVAKMFVFSALNWTYRSSAQIALNCSNVSWHALQV
jgi:hypothetical protein